MVVIKKIRIKNFRSIVDETIDLSDMNFFVGKNDSGKSNVLKALNLFFNNQTEFLCDYNFSLDYSKLAKKVAKHAEEITISLEIVIPDSFQDAGTKIWTKTWRKAGFHNSNIDEIFDKSIKGKAYLNRIQYLYIPAVKSNEYFKYLLSQVYFSMTQTADTTLKDINEKYSLQLQALTENLTLQIKEILHMHSAVQMPSNLNVLFRDLSFSTSDNFVDNINLDQRGDGIKARHIPSILRYMQSNIENNKPKNAVGSTFIWGFEEPENGVEYLSSFELADELYTYCKECQMLITTHSPAFYIKSETNNAQCFYVYKGETGKSQYQKNISKNEISENIGFLPLVAPYIKQERENFLERERILEKKIDDITKEYQNRTSRVIILTEGKTDIKHIKNAFEHLAVGKNVRDKLDYYNYSGNQTLGDELSKLLEHLSRIPKENIIIGIFDRDKHIIQNDKGKNYKSIGNKVYRFNIPALNNEERDEKDKICIEHYYTNKEIETQTDFGHLYMGKDFDDYGLSHDKNFCYQNYAKNNSMTKIKIIDSTVAPLSA